MDRLVDWRGVGLGTANSRGVWQDVHVVCTVGCMGREFIVGYVVLMVVESKVCVGPPARRVLDRRGCTASGELARFASYHDVLNHIPVYDELEHSTTRVT